ncbi:hypothetical protein BCR43DRAFT_566362 [Syncephalastrum racemosum]|uniref:Uncharacterized protein n=1 Tax=Syncephalastrum racemosum TaxID=13706 RepID=A0A1X2H2U2_SYNRA|nr:hypothetical protein BCR43DRAFT_566362 [Syncephalastrum racemosum]
MFLVLVDWWKKQRQKRRGEAQHYCKRNRRVSLFGRKENLSEPYRDDHKSNNNSRKRRTWAPATVQLAHHQRSQLPDTSTADMKDKSNKDNSYSYTDEAHMEDDEQDKEQQCLLFHCIETALSSSMVLVDERLVFAENNRPKRWSTGMLQDMRLSDPATSKNTTHTTPSAIKRQRRISYRRPPICGNLLPPIPEVDSQFSSESAVAVS